MRKIRVLIVEDSLVIRQLLEHIIASDPRLEVVAAVPSAEEALRVLNRVSPDVISMDICLPGMNGFEATQQIMREKPTPVVVVASSAATAELHITMNALRAGALSVLEKPAGVTSHEYASLANQLCTQLAIMSQVKVVRRHGRTKPSVRLDGFGTTRLLGYRLLGIVSSTGGPNALIQLLGGLGADFPLPILVVQHIASTFLKGFAAWLNDVCPFQVEIVRDRLLMSPGKIYLACQDHHLHAENGFVRVARGNPVCGQRPSGTVLFESMAGSVGSQGLGVLLTGMGEDGAAGLLQLRQRGGYTIAEDETTAVVYGMPAEAVRLGAICESLPLPAIAARLREVILARTEVA